MGWAFDFEKQVRSDAVKHLAKHEITVKKNDGLYRHFHCADPKENHRWFDVVTWPGYLCYCGDMGEFVFQRNADMLVWISSACRDPHYAAGKCVARGDEIREWREEVFREELNDVIESAKDDGEAEHEERKELVADIIDQYENYVSKHDALKAMYESGIWDGCDMPSCEAYSYRFVWCLAAIEWLLKQLDLIEAAKAAEEQPNANGS